MKLPNFQAIELPKRSVQYFMIIAEMVDDETDFQPIEYSKVKNLFNITEEEFYDGVLDIGALCTIDKEEFDIIHENWNHDSRKNNACLMLSNFIKNFAIESNIEDFVALYDCAQIERAMFNLIKNSVEAIDQKSITKKVLLTASKNEQGVQISVEDSGVGLKVDPARIFKGIKTTKTHGTGLGLLVTRKIVEAHGGSVVAGKSELLGGAKFTVTIPNQEGKA